MSPPTQRKRAPRKKKKAAPGFFLIFLPLITGLVVTPFAVWGASVLAMSGPASLRLLYPYVVLVQRYAEHLNTGEELWAQAAMYVQFPIYGVVWMLARRLLQGSAGVLSVILLHCGGMAAAILSAS